MQMTEEPQIRVGIMERERVGFLLHDYNDGGPVADGVIEARRTPTGVGWSGGEAPSLLFTPMGPGSWFEIRGVTIGVNFHWERSENQRFRGALHIFPHPDEADLLIVVNIIGVEEYLKSVISSEMSAQCSEALLMAHAIMSRSWLLRQLGDAGSSAKCAATSEGVCGGSGAPLEIIRWYDRENHRHYDVCADDHCQRYQGITRQTTPTVSRAVELTRGQVLTCGGKIADARFHKCCGGLTELFENCWEPVSHPYLRCVSDTLPGEERPLCDTDDDTILRQVLNDYDRESRDFFRWEERYTPGRLSEIIRERSGIDLGEILDLKAVERGASGRIIRLKIVGSKQTVTVGKELEIRRWLSPSHLRSSWFDVSRTPGGDWLLKGRGWGHGAGLCQIGAAVMGARGFSAPEILAHYFPATAIERIYD